MASRGLGTLTLDLIARIGGFEQGMDKAARVADKRMKEIEARANKFGKFLGTAIAAGATAAVAGVIALTKNAIDAADRLNDISQRLGVSTEALSAWGYAAQQSGTDLEALNTGLTRFTKNVAAAMDEGSRQGEIFAALGISVKDAEGNLRSVESLVPEVAQAFKDLDNATLEASLAQELFGKSGANLLQFLNLGSTGLSEMEQRARDLGLVISGETAAAADEFNDQLANLKALATGAGTQLAAELLPALTDIVIQMREALQEGGKLNKIIEWMGDQADAAAADFRRMSNDLDALVDVLRGVASQGASTLGVMTSLASLDFTNAKKSLLGLLAAREQTMEALTRDNKTWANVTSGSSTYDPRQDKALFVPEDGNGSRTEAALNRLLAGGGSKSGKKTGKSEAEKEAEALQRAYESMNGRLKEQVALFGQTGEAAQLRYDLEFGALAKLDPLKKAELLQMAEKLDALNDEAEVQKQLDAINKRREEAVSDVLDDIRTETDLLGQSVEYQDTYNKLKWAGVEANSAFGRSIIEANRALHEQARRVADQVELMDTFRTEASNALADVVTGTKSLSDAFKDMFDNIAERITQMIADRWIEQLFGQTGTTGTGQSSGSWGWVGQLFGSLFGGGRASGGSVNQGMFYRVNENGPELLTVGGRDYLMMGDQSGHITPNKSGGGSSTVNQTFVVSGAPDRRTREQMARMSGREAARGMSRTGR